MRWSPFLVVLAAASVLAVDRWHDAAAEHALTPAPSLSAPPARSAAVAPRQPWTFAVIADLHTPDSGDVSPALETLVAAVIAQRPRLVIVAGDHTNGNPGDGPRRTARARRWWDAVRKSLAPIRAAGIPVLPTAGNHDSDSDSYRAQYAAAFADLDAWAAPLTIVSERRPGPDVAVDAAPFSYAVEVDGVHLALAHVVDRTLDPRVAAWLAADLEATTAPVRIVVGHVPLSSVMTSPSAAFAGLFGGLLQKHGVSLYIAGHEHLVWDELVPIGGGARLRQVIVGTASGRYNYGPGEDARRRAGCRRVDGELHCRMPHGGARFSLHVDRRASRGSLIQHQRQTFTLFTVAGSSVTAHAMGLNDRGGAVAFDLAAPRGSDEVASLP